MLDGYGDSDYGGDSNDRKTTSGVFLFLGGNLVTWMSQEHRIVALSSWEVDYVSLTLVAFQGVWLANLVRELTRKNLKLVKIFVDNKLAIDLAKNHAFDNHSKKTHQNLISLC